MARYISSLSVQVAEHLPYVHKAINPQKSAITTAIGYFFVNNNVRKIIEHQQLLKTRSMLHQTGSLLNPKIVKLRPF